MKRKKGFLRVIALFCALILTALPLVSCGAPAEKTDGEKPASGEPKKRVAFTFDDGPTPGITNKFLDKIEELDVEVTFFVVGNRVSQYGDELLKRAVKLGCEIGTHTWNHPNNFDELSATATKEQLDKSCEIIEEATGERVRLFRPVGGEISDAQLGLAASMGLYTVCWYVDSNDWRAASADDLDAFIEEKVNYIVNTVEDGDIILMHDLRESSYEIFARAADRLIAQGYDIVTVSEILEITPTSKPEAKIYRWGDPIDE
ncbi:MAG: polysaccharide deacetylase family protein [Clostridia bacterium]|nr:polysaccharide deacetylase family protein [Clostridia bacterium]